VTQRPSDRPEFDRLPDHLAKRVLTRASEIDAQGAAVKDLREAASEAGISQHAFDAALAEVHSDAIATAAGTTPRPAPRAPRRFLAGLAAILIVIGIFFVARVRPARVDAAAASTAEQVFRLNCLTGGEAAELIRGTLKSPYAEVRHNPRQSPNLLTVRGTPEEIKQVGALLEQRDSPQACRVPPAPR
jgi:hypothetical protein